MTGRLAARDLIAGVTQSVYVNNNNKATAFSFNILNRGITDAEVYVGITNNQNSISPSEYVEFDTLILPKNSLLRTGLMVDPGKFITMMSNKSLVSAVVYGVQAGTTTGSTTINYIGDLAATPIIQLDPTNFVSFPYTNLDTSGPPAGLLPSGSTIFNIRNSSLNGTISGLVYPRSDKTLQFGDGNIATVDNGSISLGSSPGTSTTALSVSAWVYDQDISQTYRDFVTRNGTFKLRVDNLAEGQKLSAFVWVGGNAEPRLSSPLAFVKNVWTHVSFTWNTNGNFRLFINGSVVANSTTRSGTLGNSGTLTVGSDAASNYFYGRMGGVAIYNRTLSDGEILANFEAERSLYGI